VKLVKGEGRAKRARARSPRRAVAVSCRDCDREADALYTAVTVNCRLMRIMVVSSVQVHSPLLSSSGTYTHSHTQVLLLRRPLSSPSVLLLSAIPNASFARTLLA
jgi:hypothetical protein